MTLEQLRVFVAVAEREHVTRAAEALEMTQSAASAAIATLEREFSTRLFHRVGRGIALTESGRLLLGEARGLLARAEAVQAAMREFLGMARGRLVIQASQTIASHVLPRILVRFHARWPGIELVVAAGNTAQVARSVADGTVELGFIEGPVSDPDLALERIGGDRMIVVVAPGHPWAAREQVSPAELLEGLWVVREAGSGTRAVMQAALESLNVDMDLLKLGALELGSLKIGIELPSNEAVLNAVREGAGAAALSELVCAEALAAGHLIRVPVTLPPRDFFAVQHQGRYRSRAVSALLQMLRNGDSALVQHP